MAALEGIIVLAVLAGVFFGCLLLGRWATGIQSAHMGARLLTFGAGDTAFARLGSTSRVSTRDYATASWDTLVDAHVDTAKARWLGSTFTLTNQLVTGSVVGTAQGRVPGESPGLLSFARKTLGYRAGYWTAATNPWLMSKSSVQAYFLLMCGNVVLGQVDTSVIATMAVNPIPQQVAILETVFGRVGIR